MRPFCKTSHCRSVSSPWSYGNARQEPLVGTHGQLTGEAPRRALHDGDAHAVGTTFALPSIFANMSERAATKAVCIGFCPTYTQNTGLPTLKRTVTSVKLLLAALVERCDFISRGFVSGASVTADSILKSVTKLALEVQSCTLVVIDFCGHGVRFGGKSCLVTDDGAVVPARLLASIVAKQVLERELTDVRLVLVFDCCRFEVPRVEGDTPDVGTSECVCLTWLACDGYRRRALQAESEPALHIRGVRRKDVRCDGRRHVVYGYSMVDGPMCVALPAHAVWRGSGAHYFLHLQIHRHTVEPMRPAPRHTPKP